MSWHRLIRLEDEVGCVKFGEPCINDAEELDTSLQRGSLVAKVLVGSDPFALKETGDKCKVKKLLPILKPENVPIIKCIGLNYMKHSKVVESCVRKIMCPQDHVSADSL